MITRDSDAPPTVRFIEFTGLPGSGKSTVAACLVSVLRRNGIKAVSRSAVLADNSPFIWRQYRRLLVVARNSGECWRLYGRSLRFILNSGQDSVKDIAKVTWNFWSVIALMADSRKTIGSIIVVDQGLLQAIWSVQLTASRILPIDLWKDLLFAAGVNDILVVNIRTEIDTARHRALTRTSNGTRLILQPDGGSDSQWNAASTGMSRLLHLAEGMLPPDLLGQRVITIENGATSAEIAAMQIASIFLARRTSSDASHQMLLSCHGKG